MHQEAVSDACGKNGGLGFSTWILSFVARGPGSPLFSLGPVTMDSLFLNQHKSGVTTLTSSWCETQVAKPREAKKGFFPLTLMSPKREELGTCSQSQENRLFCFGHAPWVAQCDGDAVPQRNTAALGVPHASNM